MPRVSAIIVTHNRLPLLKKAVASVQAQSFGDWELIVVDDASADGTPEWLREQQAKGALRCVCIPPEEHKNGNYARNLGAEQATGEYLAYLDDDDEWLPDKTALQVGLMDAHPECGVCIGGQITCCDDGRSFVPPMEPLRQGDVSQYIFTCILGLTSLLLLRRKVFRQVGGFDETQNFWQEYELMIRLCQVSKVCCVYQPLIRYRVGRADPARLTNKYFEWLQTVEQQSQKYAQQIDALPPEMKTAREMMILQDALVRTENAGQWGEHKKWRRRYYQLRPSPAAFVCWQLNLSKAATDRLHQMARGLRLLLGRE